MSYSPQLEKWLNDRGIADLNDLQNFLIDSFNGAITNHNVRYSVDLTCSQLSKMNEYFTHSIDVNDKYPDQTLGYNQEQFDNWKSEHERIDD